MNQIRPLRVPIRAIQKFNRMPEDVDRVVDPDGLLEDAEGRVAGDVEREQPWRCDAPLLAEQDQKPASDRFQMIS